MRVKLAQKWSTAVPAVLENGRLAQYCPLWPCDGVSGLGQNARTTGGAGILPAAILRDARLKRLKWTVLGETPREWPAASCHSHDPKPTKRRSQRRTPIRRSPWSANEWREAAFPLSPPWTGQSDIAPPCSRAPPLLFCRAPTSQGGRMGRTISACRMASSRLREAPPGEIAAGKTPASHHHAYHPRPALRF